MNDKELLMIAAKAAGLVGIHERAGKICYTSNHGHGGSVMWDPLTNGDDALRLAVKLEFDITTMWDGDTHVTGYSGLCCIEPHGDDPCAATRRAIVRAAAEIGSKL